MTCAAQAAEILSRIATDGDTLLDAGCGGGYYYHSFVNRGLRLEYYGLDYTPEMIDLARTEMCCRTGLPADRFVLGAIEDLDGPFDHVVCFNVLTNNPHYALPLERLLKCARKTLVLRESLGEELVVQYTPDRYLDEGKRHMRVYHNTYPLSEVVSLMKEHGFSVSREVDRRTGDDVELVVDIPHYWRILVAQRLST